MLIAKFRAQKKLSLLWFISVGILTILFILFTILHRFDDKASKAWEWLSQTTVPTLTLMIATFTTSMGAQRTNEKVDRFYFTLAYGVSSFYLLALYLTILLAPIAFSFAHMSIMELLEESKIYLVIMQGVTTYCVGLFFTKKE